MYKYILFDVDNTLTYFRKSFINAAADVLSVAGIEPTADICNRFYEINDEAWFGLDLNQIWREDIKRNYHALYEEYLRRAVHGMVSEFGCGVPGPEKSGECAGADEAAKNGECAGVDEAAKNGGCAGADEAALNELLCRRLGEKEVISPNAIEVLKTLSETHVVSAATNGLVRLQEYKIAPFKEYFTHVFISEALGFVKPEKEYFNAILKTLGAEPSQVLMVGDSISNDIAGANAAGIASCYYNPSGKVNLMDGVPIDNTEPTYTIKDLREVLAIAKG